MNMMKSYLAFSLLAVGACTDTPTKKLGDQPAKVINPEQAKIFTTARDTNFRLTQTADVSFEEFGQPIETLARVFVDPSNTFQTLVFRTGRTQS